MRTPNAGHVALLVCAGALAVSASASGAVSHRMPTATTAPPVPKAGAYTGRTSQGLHFALQVSDSRHSLLAMTFRFRLKCSRHRAPLYTVSPIVARFPWRLNAHRGLGFARTFSDTTGERYMVNGTFGDRGAVTGSLRTTWQSSRFGTCTTGLVSWHAQLTGS